MSSGACPQPVTHTCRRRPHRDSQSDAHTLFYNFRFLHQRQSLVGHEDLGELLPASASCWKPRLMMLEEYGKSLMSSTFLSVKLDKMVESASQ